MSKHPSTDRVARRTVAKIVRFSPDEATQLEDRARICGRSFAAFIRETALGAIPRARHRVGVDPILRELACIGRDLHCLKKLFDDAPIRTECNAHTDVKALDWSSIAERLAAALDAHQKAIRSVIAQGIGRANGNLSSTKLDKPTHIEIADEVGRLTDTPRAVAVAREVGKRHDADPAQGAFW
jgi:hypothetical protein